MEFIFEILIELLLEIIVQILIGLGYGSIARAFKPEGSKNKLLGYLGIVLLSSILSLVFCLIFPSSYFPGISIIVNPIIVGLSMKYIGEWKSKKGASQTLIATFGGGALFAFIFSIIRFIIIYNEAFA